MLEIGERVFELRDARGWSQVELAERAGINPATVTHVETGKVQPRLGTLRRLARAFGVDVEELSPPPKPPPPPKTPIAASTPRELETKVYGAPADAISAELRPVLSEPEAQQLSDEARTERD